MYKLGHINLNIDINEVKSFEYIRQPLNLQEETDWKTNAYSGMTFGGELYSGKNYIPEWTKNISKELNLKDCGYSFYRMKTNNIIPTHVDHYSTYTRIFKKDIKDVIRAIVFLEDWKSGHYFEIDNHAITNWRAGDYCVWTYKVPHFAANIGLEDRYTLQITGTY